MRPITEAVLTEQQGIAELLHDLRIVPKKVDVREAALSSQQYAVITPNNVQPKG